MRVIRHDSTCYLVDGCPRALYTSLYRCDVYSRQCNAYPRKMNQDGGINEFDEEVDSESRFHDTLSIVEIIVYLITKILSHMHSRHAKSQRYSNET